MAIFTFSKREKYLGIITFFIISIAVFYNLVLEPIFLKWKDISREINLKEVEFRKAAKLLKEKDSIIDQYNNYAKSLNPPELLSRIEKIAGASNIYVINIKPLPLIHKDLYRELLIELNIEGKILDIDKFIFELSKEPSYLALDRFNLQRLEERPSVFKGTLILSRLFI